MIELALTHRTTGNKRVVLLQPTESKREFLIGRYANADVFIDDPFVSRFHAKILGKDQQYVVSDQASSGGTTLNGVPLSPMMEYPLHQGAEIQLGEYQLRVTQVAIAADSASFQQALAKVSTAFEIKTQVHEDLVDQDSTVMLSAPPPIVQPPAEAAAKPKDDKWKDLKVKCVRLVNETADVKTFYFSAEGRQFNYKPGQFATLNLNIDDREVLRSYSISSSPSRPHLLEITIKRVPAPTNVPDAPPGLVSNWMHDHISVGSEITLSGPLGKFTCVDHPAKKLFFISAGSGITPMMSMSRWILDRALDYDIVFFHAARSAEDIIYRQELEWMSSRHPNFQLFVTTTRSNIGSAWSGLRGRLTPDMLRVIAPDYTDRFVYVCGPDEFMKATKDLLEQQGYPMEHYHEESFGGPKKKKSPAKVESATPAPVAPAVVEPPASRGWLSEFANIKPSVTSDPSPVAASAPAASAAVLPSKAVGSQTVIVFEKSGKEVSCGSDDLILDMAEQEGVKIRSSCRVGTCGTCKKRKLSGEVQFEDYDAEALEPDEIAEGFILTCVAHPIGRVVIDA